ncbi:MAG: N-acetylmuramoyl-L-alanine amidase, partial [Candidatus Glassbacteria bacterium]|nr:N-acetylmuramoyl-L-alanine amidase [Candidatus Glassbacteria bacterium]
GPSPLQDPYPLLVTRVYDETGARGIDPQQVEATIDGEPVPFSYDPAGGRLEALASRPLSNGPHRAAVRARNLSGNAARESVAWFSIALPPAGLRLTSSLEALPLDGSTPARVSAVVSDTRGAPVADGTEVLLEFSDLNLPTRTLTTSGGIASVAVLAVANRPLTVVASAGDISEQITIPVGETPGKSTLVLKTLDRSGEPLDRVRVMLGGTGIFSADRDGILTLTGLAQGTYRLRCERPGYRPAELEVSFDPLQSRSAVCRLEPVMGGVLLGRRIAVDPQAGGENPGQLGPEGTREADVNLSVARYLADYLERAGAAVSLTRGAETGPGPWERAACTEESGSEVLVSISHSGEMGKKLPPPTTVHYYPGSVQGELLAGPVADCLKGFASRPYHGASPGNQRIIQQVGCPAVWVRAASVADNQAESRLSDPVYLRMEAGAIFSGICRYFGWEPQGAVPHLTGRISDGAGGTIQGALVLLDGWRPAQSDEAGRFLFQFVDQGPHQVEVIHRGRLYGPHPAVGGRLLELLLGND